MNPFLPKLFRPSLRLLMAFVMVIGGGSGWLAHRARTQRLAVTAITRAGGWIEYSGMSESERGDSGPTAQRLDARSPPYGPRWLRESLGVDMIETVTAVGVEGPGIDDQLMAQIATLHHLKSLTLNIADGASHPTITGFAQLERLSQLQDLIISGRIISDRALPHLGHLNDLRHVRMYQAAPADSDLSKIARCSRLEELVIDGSNLSVAGLSDLAGLRTLRHLVIGGVDTSKTCHRSLI